MKSKIATRITFGAIMIAILGGLLYLDWWLQSQEALPAYCKFLPTVVVLAAIVALGFRELRRLALGSECNLLSWSGTIGAVLLAVGTYLAVQLYDVGPSRLVLLAGQPAMLPVLVLMAIFLEQMIRFRTANALRNVAATMLAVAYLGLCGSLILHIRMIWGVPELVLFLAAVKCTDIGAYFTGTAIGRHKLIPWLSPGKSWEGLFGGLITAAGVSMLACRLMHIPLALHEAAAFGVVVGLAGQFGDLCESLLKRSAQIKDSGSVVPEFGGVLDIIDSPLLAAPVAVILLTAMLN